jgi:hypothetical protein
MSSPPTGSLTSPRRCAFSLSSSPSPTARHAPLVPPCAPPGCLPDKNDGRSRLGTRENTRQQQREAMAACKCLPGWPNEHEAIRETAHRRRPLTAQKMKPMVTNDPGGHIPPRGKHAQATKKRAGKNSVDSPDNTIGTTMWR